MKYKYFKLGDCLSLITNGFVIKQSRDSEKAGGYPFTRIETLSNGRFNRDRMGYADIYDLKGLESFVLEDEDIIISHINSRRFLGRSVLYKKIDDEIILHGMNVLRIKTNLDILNPVYANYFFQTEYYKQCIDNIRKDAINQSSFSIGDFQKLVIPLPEIEYQEKIADVLSSLDRKIALNRAINRNLEALAKQLYDYWFVQFDFPDENGRPYKSSGGKMVWNEVLKREVPEGWEAKTLFESTNVQYGFPFSTESFTEEITDVPVVRIRDILDGTVSAYSYEDTDEKYHLQEGDVLVGMDGNFHMNYWHNNNAYLNQRCVRIRPYCDSPISSIQVLHAIKPYIKAKEQNAKGSTVGHLSDKDMKGLFLLEPKVSQLYNPRKTFDPILKQIIKNKQEIAVLTHQRDELLPLLMNGQITIG